MPDILDHQWGYRYCVGFKPEEIGRGVIGLCSRLEMSSWLRQNYTLHDDFEVTTLDVMGNFSIYKVLVYLRNDEILLKFTLRFF